MRISRFGVFCRVMAEGSFTRAANALGYTQSAVSQTIKGLERELGTTLLDRAKEGLRLTHDGEEFFPYIQSIYAAEIDLEKKSRALHELQNAEITIGTFTSVSRNMLPPLMRAFKESFPSAKFTLRQGEYDQISEWLREGTIDIGFIDVEKDIPGIQTQPLMEDEILAVLPKDHPLVHEECIPLSLFATEPFILLDEGDSSAVLEALREANITPNIEYVVTDDYSILSMVEQGLGVSALYKLLLEDIATNLVVKAIEGNPKRHLALAYRDSTTLSLAARAFATKIIEAAHQNEQEEPATRQDIFSGDKDFNERLIALQKEAQRLSETNRY